jgi:hypothetical protein
MRRVKIHALPKAQDGTPRVKLQEIQDLQDKYAVPSGYVRVPDVVRKLRIAKGIPADQIPEFEKIEKKISPELQSILAAQDARHDAYKKVEEEEQRKRDIKKFRPRPINDPAGLPSVPIFEAALMAPVALGQAGLSGLLGTEILGTGVTAGNIANPLFAAHGVYNFANPDSDFRQALSKYNNGNGDWRDVALEGGLNALNFMGAKALPGDIKAISNARAPQLYKYNPWAWKPNAEAYYHRSPNLENIINLENGTLQGFGQSAEGRLFSETKDYYPGTKLNLRKPANSRLYFSKGVPLDYGRYNPETFNQAGKRIMTGQGYAGPYMVEVEGVPMGSSVKGRAPSASSPTSLEGYAVSHRPITLPEAKFYKEHWLKGYKPVDMDKKLDLTSLYRIEPKGATFPSFTNPYDPGYIDWSMPISELQTDPRVAKMMLDDPKTWSTVDWGEVTGIGANGDRRIAQYYPQSAEGNWWSTDHPNVNNHMFPTINGNEALQMMEVKIPRKILPQYQSLAVSPAYGNPRPDEFILPGNWRKGAKVTDWESPKKAEGGDISIPDLSKAQDGTFDYYTAAKRKNDEQRRIEQMRNQIIPIAISHDATSDNRPFHVRLPEGQPYCTTRACEAEREAGFPIKQVASGYKLMNEATPENGWYPTSYDKLLPGDMAQVVRNSGFGHTMLSTGNVSNMPEGWRGDADPNQKGFYWDNGSGQDFQFATPKSENQLAGWMDNVKRMNYYTYKGNLPQYEKEYQQATQNYLHDTSEGDNGPMVPIDAIPHKKQGGAVKRVKINGLPKNWKSQ